MIIEASVTGFFRTILIILGAFVLLRFLGQLMTAKRNMEEERALNEKQRKFNKERNQKIKSFGKTSILNSKNQSSKSSAKNNAIDVDYEEIN